MLRRRPPRLALRIWIVAAIIGAMVAWGLGTLPSTLMSTDAGGGQAAEMPEALTYVMAAGMGLVAGVFLALVQWLALRSHVRQAGLWLPANAMAWLCGMPLVFLDMSAIPAGTSAVADPARTDREHRAATHDQRARPRDSHQLVGRSGYIQSRTRPLQLA